MKSIEIIGYNRANLGKKETKAVRAQGLVPCVMYGGAEQRHFNVPYLLFRDLVYTPNAMMVDVNIEGNTFRCILQDMQFHPVNDSILHADFMELNEEKPLRMEIPVRLNGTAVGVTKGGKISMILPKLKVVALPKDMPDFVDIDVSDLDLGKSVKVSAVPAGNFKILNTPATPIASIVVPRALRGKTEAA